MRCNGLAIALGAGLGAFVVTLLCAERRAHARLNNRNLIKEEINTWDSEGGSIPNVPPPRPEPGTVV